MNKKYWKKHYGKHKEEIKIKVKEYVEKNKDKRKETQRKYYQNNKKRWIKYIQYYNKLNSEKIKEWYINNKGKILLKRKKYKADNPKKIKELKHKNYIKHKEKVITRQETTKKYGKAKICSNCGSTVKVQHHHYTNPYERDKFIDLCSICHIKVKIGVITLNIEKRFKPSL